MMVKELEEQLGIRLFERTTRAMRLTEAGQVLQQHATSIVAQVQQLGLALQGSSSAARSSLTIAATPVIATALLPQVVARFAQQYPEIRIQIIDGNLDLVRQAVVDGQADLGIAFFVKPTAGMVREPIGKFRLMCISPPSPRQQPPFGQRSWESLRGLRMISLPPQNPIQALIDKHLPDAKASQSERTAMNFLGTIMAMVHAGHGHAILPSFMAQECQQHGLTMAMLDEPAVHLDMYVARRRGAASNMSDTQFIEVLKTHLQTSNALVPSCAERPLLLD